MNALFSQLPTIKTRKALLLLDFQNDFVRPSGSLHVPNTADFLDSIPSIVAAFRAAGDVVWIRSVFEERRPLVDYDQELVVVHGGGGGPSKQRADAGLDDPDAEERKAEAEIAAAEAAAETDEEAFLTTDAPQCGQPQTPGTQFPAPLLAAIDANTDTLLEKSDYSALRSQSLILSFRSRLVTEVYICGSLSNISVYATVLDAVSLGFSVTLIEDCLGFRDFGRHQEAMRRMADIFGANGITTEELCEELEWQETDAIAQKGGPRPVRVAKSKSAGIESVLDDLDFRVGADGAPEEPPALHRGSPCEEDDDDMLGFSKIARARNRHRRPSLQENPQPQGQDVDKKVRVRVRRPRRPEQKSEPSARDHHRRSRRSKLSQDLSGPGDRIGEGDSRIIHDLDLPAEAFATIRNEVAWQKMYHMSGQVPRLVAVQGRQEADGSFPIYRHPADESPPLAPFTSTVDQVRVIVERILGHPLNHVLIQLYRDGQDRISEHSDKTLDIVRGSSICNVSLGAQRVMVLRTKSVQPEDPSRQTQRVPLPHESLFVLGERTNMRWLHGIRQDKRPNAEKSVEDRAYGGERISLTFRHIGTFLNPNGDTIWGQGAVSKAQGQSRPVVHGDAYETERIIHAFGKENHATEFDWDDVYGSGFDVVNFVTASTAQLIPGDDPVSKLRAQLGLSESSMRYDTISGVSGHGDRRQPVYIGTDGTRIAGDIDILMHLSQLEDERPGVDSLRGGDHLSQIEALLTTWREKHSDCLLQTWEETLAGRHYLGGSVFSIDDCSLWPILREIVREKGEFSTAQYPNLYQYYSRVGKRGLVKAVLEGNQ